MYELELYGDTKSIRPTNGSLMEFKTSIGNLNAVIIEKDFELRWGYLIGVPTIDENIRVIESAFNKVLPGQFNEWIIPPFLTRRASFSKGICFWRNGKKIDTGFPFDHVKIAEDTMYDPKVCARVPLRLWGKISIKDVFGEKKDWELREWVSGGLDRIPEGAERRGLPISKIAYSLSTFDLMLAPFFAYMAESEIPKSKCRSKTGEMGMGELVRDSAFCD